MDRESLQKELQDIIANGDDTLLEKIYNLVKDDTDIPEERMKMILQEQQDYLDGKGKSYSWEEAKEIVKNRKPGV